MEEITLGFNWNSNMEFSEFRKLNLSIVSEESAWDLFNIIEQRYIDYVYERDFKNQ